MKFLTVKSIAKISALLALISLATPFVWMKIGPGGYLVYGPTVPDIYIFGGFILGKDISFWGISFAITFQIIFILYFILNCVGILVAREKNHAISFNCVNAFLLIGFPYWLKAYVSGVVCNSDGADLTIHYHAGMLIYGILCLLNLLTFVMIFLSRKTAWEK